MILNALAMVEPQL